ncbi:hypothetical protein GCM10010400_77480 [Streptomyces aculeolatus]|uniref:DUF3853 family protein n=1 Tax=Streptomyces aculeolatus TaxID=270689 RepID=UPI001CED4238|nr:DUF3853 family protein [Streptomyces aculeolatus]
MATSDRYAKYGRPQAPADPNQEYMTIQETASVLGCSVDTIRRLLKELDIKAKVGRRVITDKADRALIYEYRRSDRKPVRRRTSQPRRPAAA